MSVLNPLRRCADRTDPARGPHRPAKVLDRHHSASLAYALVELSPELSNSGQGRRALRGIRKTIDPGGDLRQRQREHQLSGSVAAARHLAGEVMEDGHNAGAIEHYEHDPDLLPGLATARFKNEECEKARDTLDRLIAHNPDFKSQDGHLKELGRWTSMTSTNLRM